MDLKALEQSLVLGAAGMAVIFVFMAGLIVLIHFYIKFATRFFPDRKAEPQPGTGEPESANQDEAEVAAAVAAASRGNGA